MTNRNRGLGIGIAITVVGLVAIFANLQVIRSTEHLLGAGIFWVIAYVFFQAFQNNKSRRWSLWCAILFAILGVAAVFRLFWHFPENLISLIFLWGGATLFGSIYANKAKHWWAIIPAGLFLTLGAMVAVDAFHLLPEKQQGVVFFFGFGLTFVYLWTQGNAYARLNWAKYPAAGMILLALLVFAESTNWLRLDVLLPAALVLMGGFVLYGALRKR